MEPLADNGLIWEFIPPFLNTFFSMIIMVFLQCMRGTKLARCNNQIKVDQETTIGFYVYGHMYLLSLIWPFHFH